MRPIVVRLVSVRLSRPSGSSSSTELHSAPFTIRRGWLRLAANISRMISCPLNTSPTSSALTPCAPVTFKNTAQREDKTVEGTTEVLTSYRESGVSLKPPQSVQTGAEKCSAVLTLCCRRRCVR
ncbi:hypothetical protein GBF38_017856 [Nibea albiflora]|uniref:Uncharacterized protein n=1 Tax=Nibea albiflora TaxID=240163 RepID=A0ACB7F4V4_NIBAL|nr:hypothetical protein GBF38_017856 [Nibea albiflora]